MKSAPILQGNALSQKQRMEILEVRDKGDRQDNGGSRDDPLYGDIALPYSVLRSAIANSSYMYGVRSTGHLSVHISSQEQSRIYSRVSRLLHFHCQMILGIAHHPILDTRPMQEADSRYHEKWLSTYMVAPVWVSWCQTDVPCAEYRPR